jgi:hypothetical protein
MKNLGPVKHYLGIKVHWDWFKHEIRLTQTEYATDLLKCFGMEDCTSKKTPMESGIQLDMNLETMGEILAEANKN